MDSKEMQQKLLSDPQVQEAVTKAGKDALNDPQVQQMIIKTAQEKFPEYAGAAKQVVHNWAKDPEVQAQAYHYAGLAGEYAGQAGEHVLGLVEQGPTGVRLLAFAAGVLSCVNAAMFLIDITNLVANLVTYVICGYQIVFAFTTMLFEAPPTVIQKLPGLTQYQDMLIDKAKFISEVMGRGLFYIFCGSLWMAFASLAKLLDFITGVALCIVGLLHVAMHFGKLGVISSKLRDGYEKARGSAPPAGP